MAGDQITVDNLRQLLHVQTELREQAEARWQKAQRALVSLLESFAPEEADRRLKNGQLLDNLPVEELEALVRNHIGTRLNQAQTLLNHSKTNNIKVLMEKLQEKEQTIVDLTAENKRNAERVDQLEAQKAGLENQLAALQQVSIKLETTVEKVQENVQTPDSPAPVAQPEEPEWMSKWRRSDTFDRDSTILKMIGETGLSRRPVIETHAAEILGIKKPGGSIQSLLARLVRLELIEIYRPWKSEGAGTGGRYPDLVRLIDKGNLSYWLLTGKRPKPNEFDALLKSHVTPEHTLLNLQAADVLCEAGYKVNLNPPDIRLPSGGLFKPDIVMVDEHGVTLFVEVERGANKDLEKRQAKWRNFYQASGGRIHVVCDNRTCMRNIRSEINYFLGKQQAAVFLTNLADLQAGKRGVGESVWLDIKRRRL